MQVQCKAFKYNEESNICRHLIDIPVDENVQMSGEDWDDGFKCYYAFRYGVVLMQHGLGGSSDDWVANDEVLDASVRNCTTPNFEVLPEEERLN